MGSEVIEQSIQPRFNVVTQTTIAIASTSSQTVAVISQSVSTSIANPGQLLLRGFLASPLSAGVGGFAVQGLSDSLFNPGLSSAQRFERALISGGIGVIIAVGAVGLVAFGAAPVAVFGASLVVGYIADRTIKESAFQRRGLSP